MDKNLEELFLYIQTEEGKQWVKARGINPIKLLKEMEQDPIYKTKKIRVREGLELSPGNIIALMGDFYAHLLQVMSNVMYTEAIGHRARSFGARRK